MEFSAPALLLIEISSTTFPKLSNCVPINTRAGLCSGEGNFNHSPPPYFWGLFCLRFCVAVSVESILKECSFSIHPAYLHCCSWKTAGKWYFLCMSRWFAGAPLCRKQLILVRLLFKIKPRLTRFHLIAAVFYPPLNCSNNNNNDNSAIWKFFSRCEGFVFFYSKCSK